MSTDPFSDIAFQQEIGQPTFAELIYTKVREGKSFPPSTATVENSVNRLAFGKPGPYRDIDAQTPPKIVTTPPNPTRRQYNLSGTTTPQTAQALKAQKIQADFRKLVTNPGTDDQIKNLIRKQSGDPVLNAPFDTVYDIVNLGAPIGLPVPYAGLVFSANDPNVIWAGGSGNNPIAGGLYAVPVTRGSDGHITAVGSATRIIDAPNIDGGVAYHPSGVLFVCGWPSNTLHQYKPGSTAPDKTTNLSSLGVQSSVGSIGFVPIGYPGAGNCYIVTWPAGATYRLDLTPDGNGLFNVGPAAAMTDQVPGGPEGFVYVPLGSALFPNPSMMVTEYSRGQVSAYELGTAGQPDISTRRIFLTGLANAEGAAVDPLTGDYVFSTFGGSNLFFLIRGGFVPPNPGTPPACNKVVNSTFDNDIASWTPSSGAVFWESVRGRLRINAQNAYATQIITGLTPGAQYTINFKAFFSGNGVGTVGYSTVGTGQYLFSGNNGELKSFTIEGGFVPANGQVQIDLVNNGLNTIDFDDVFLCLVDPTGDDGTTNPPCNKIANGFFDTGVQGWTAAGPSDTFLWDGANRRMTILNGLTYTAITGLTPGKKLNISLKVYWLRIPSAPPGFSLPPDTVTWEVETQVRADIVNGPQLAAKTVSGTQNSNQSVVYDVQVTVPPSGIIYFWVWNKNYSEQVPNSPNVQMFLSPIQVDNIIICEVEDTEGACTDPITGVRTLVQWNGIPRQPLNVFNILLRLVYRNINDPFSKITSEVLAVADGRLGTVTPASCSTGNTADFWKQDGDNTGQPQSLITAQGLQGITSSITAGQFASVADRENFLWSIPGNTGGTLQDALVSLFDDPTPPANHVLESVEILALMQVLNQTGLSGVSEILDVTGSAAVPGEQSLISVPLIPGGSPPTGDPQLDTNGFTSYWRSSPTPISIPSPPGQHYVTLGAIDLPLSLPTTQPPYANFSVPASSLWLRHYYATNTNNTAFLQASLFVNGNLIGSSNVQLPAGIPPNDESFEATNGNIFGALPTVAAPITSIVMRFRVIVSISDESGGIPRIDLAIRQLALVSIGSLTGDSTCPGPFQISPDPGFSLDLVLRYVNNSNQAREFRKTFLLTALHQVSVGFPTSPKWDAQTATGGGILGSIARWESAKFVLDAVDGSGLDQCTTPLEFVTTGTGRFNFNKFRLRGRGSAIAACDAKLVVTEINKGVAVNEIQSIILPNPSGGHWALTFNFAGTTATTTNIPWDATAVQVRNKLEALSNIGAGNVEVTGKGTPDVPFNIKFIGTMGGRDLRPLVADGSGLTGASTAFAIKVSTGTRNERQTITKTAGVNSGLLVTFSGIQSQPIAFNSSLNEMQAILEGISTIGPGNVLVTGATTNRDADYQGPWYVDFVGALAGQNVPTFNVQTTGYSASTNWQGGTGINDVQKIIVSAVAGSFKLVVTKPGAIPDVTGFNAQTSSFVGGVRITWTPNLTPGLNITIDDSADGVTWNLNTRSVGASVSEVNYTALPTGQQRLFRARFTDGTNFSANYATDDAIAGDGSTPAPPPPAPPAPPPPAPPAAGSSTTDPIDVNAEAQQIKQKILAVAGWLDGNDLVVTRLPDTPGAPDLNQWTIEFTGDWAKQNIPLVGVQDVNLRGASVIVRETSKGSGSGERQKINMFKAAGGTYRLKVTVNGVTGTTVLIPWDASAESVQLALQALPLFPLPDDISVKDAEIREPDVVNSFIVSFNRRFGDVPLIETVNNLQCNPLTLSAVGPPPYDYKLPECDEEIENLFCSPGALLCRPGEGDPEVPEETCCDPITIRDSANYYREVVLQRDLFDPNSHTTSGKALTIKDMAVLKGLRPSQYNAYLRDFYTGILRPVDMTTAVDTKMSVLLVGVDIDTKATRERLSRELKRRPGVLPSRMVWSNPALQG
jgi:hypothetical protein